MVVLIQVIGVCSETKQLVDLVWSMIRIVTEGRTVVEPKEVPRVVDDAVQAASVNHGMEDAIAWAGPGSKIPQPAVDQDEVELKECG